MNRINCRILYNSLLMLKIEFRLNLDKIRRQYYRFYLMAYVLNTQRNLYRVTQCHTVSHSVTDSVTQCQGVTVSHSVTQCYRAG